MTQFPDIFAALAAPFEPHEVKIRPQAGRQLRYITARSAMNRLDSVLGPETWWDEYEPLEHSVLCRLTIRLPDGSTLTKCDAGGYAGMSDQGDDDKSGYSDAFKRAAVKFGVGRYLYGDGVPEFVRQRVTNSKQLQVGEPQPTISSAPPPGSESTESFGSDPNAPSPEPVASPPRSGRALFAWVKDQEQRNGIRLLPYLNKWGKHQDFPGRLIDWDAEQVARAYQEALRQLPTDPPNRDRDAIEPALAN